MDQKIPMKEKALRAKDKVVLHARRGAFVAFLVFLLGMCGLVLLYLNTPKRPVQKAPPAKAAQKAPASKKAPAPKPKPIQKAPEPYWTPGEWFK